MIDGPVSISRYTAAKAKVWRAVKAAAPVVGNKALIVAKSAAPVVLPFVAAAVAYRLSPDFKIDVDGVRDKLNTCPHISEALTSGVIIGLAPDLVAQRVAQQQNVERGEEVKKTDYRRLACMTVVGAVTGGLYLRGLYDLVAWLFPGKGIFTTIKQVVFDQFIATSFVYMPAYLRSVNTIMRATVNNNFTWIRKKANKLLPYNWGFWIPALSIIYNLPKDLRVYAAQGFAIIWFSLLSKIAFTAEDPADGVALKSWRVQLSLAFHLVRAAARRCAGSGQPL